MDEQDHYFFCGIGGSGMLPLALIARARGALVSGSDRGRDQGRIGGTEPAKFAWLADQGIALHPQDGSGVAAGQIFIASAAVEASVPDMARAIALNLPRQTRAELNAALFNAAPTSIGVGGTSGKSTVTGMIAWIMHRAGHAPTVMNGAVMRNFATAANPYASALIGGPDCHISEVDESDGSIALYTAAIAVVTNISLDHKSLSELHALFGGFAARAGAAMVNADDPESAALTGPGLLRFGFADHADIRASDYQPTGSGSRFTVHHGGRAAAVTLAMPGRHNVGNALAALGAAVLAGVPLADGAAALSQFAGLARRFEVIGTAAGVTVIDDFAHNPDKMAATLAALAELPGRALLLFQPHGYGPLRQMGRELAASFAAGMRADDRLWVCDPAYYGGTVDRSGLGSAGLAALVGPAAVHLPARADCAAAMLAAAGAGDRLVVLGARDDSLTTVAHSLLAALANRTGA